ncbi:MAG: major facilitator superfamily protein [Marmoricola sp.]|nr:major facilitator superfamily protein [Marmoricola sp.]
MAGTSTTATAARPLYNRDRTLDRYPESRDRARYLAIVVLVSIVIFYEIYVQGAVSTEIIADFDIPLRTFVLASILGNAAGALAAWATGIADRWGRANLIIIGSGAAALLATFGLPHTTSAGVYITLYVLLSLTGGVVLVATQALVRDFSPQLGRATAMGVWTLGPVLGNLVISVVTNRTVDAHPDWQFQYYVAGTVGLVTTAIAFVWLRELSPALRNQVMVSLADRELVEKRAATGTTVVEAAESMWTRALVVPAIGITLFLVFYITRVGFLVLYFATTFGYATSKANGLATWYWVANAIALVATGVLSDRLRVRKPFMLAGAVLSLGALAVFATRATHPDTSYPDFVVLLVLLAVGGAMVNNAWLTLFSETVERINPAAVARGMAVYGSVLRGAVTVILIGFMLTVTAAGTLADHGREVGRIAATYKAELGTLGKVAPATMNQLRADPNAVVPRVAALTTLSGLPRAVVGRAVRAGNGTLGKGLPRAQRAALVGAQQQVTAALAVPIPDLVYLTKHGAEVTKAVKDTPLEWRRWWWVCFIAQVAFLPIGLRMKGRWLPRHAAWEARVRADRAAAELAELRT